METRSCLSSPNATPSIVVASLHPLPNYHQLSSFLFHPNTDKRNDAYPERDQEPATLYHMRHPSSNMRNPTHGRFKLLVQYVQTPMDIRNEDPVGRRADCGYFVGALRIGQLRGIVRAWGRRTRRRCGLSPKSCASLTGTTSKNANCLN